MVELVSSSDYTRMRFDRGLQARMDLARSVPEIGFLFGSKSIIRLRGVLAARVARLLHLGAETIVETLNTRESLELSGTRPDDLDFDTLQALLARVESDRLPRADWDDKENEWCEWMRQSALQGVSDMLANLPDDPEDRGVFLKSCSLTLASFLASKAGGVPVHDSISWLEWAFGAEGYFELFRRGADEPGATSWQTYNRLYPNIPAIGATFVETPAEDLPHMAPSDRKLLKILDHEGRPQDMAGFDSSTAVECDFASLSLVVPMADAHPDAALMIRADEGVFGVVLPQLVDMAEIEYLQSREDALVATHFFPLHGRFLPPSKKWSRIIETA